MDNDQVFLEVKALAILLVVPQENFFRSLGQGIPGTVERIVEGLGNFEEIAATRDNVPFGADVEFRKQGHYAVQHLSNAPTDRG